MMKARTLMLFLIGGFIGGAAWLSSTTSLAFWPALELLVSVTVLWFFVVLFDVDSPP